LVSATVLLVRENNCTPSASSNLRMSKLSAGCEMNRRFAARPKCSSSATATK